jgi:hypothetical protein
MELQTVCCWPEHAEALTKSPLIKHITFIGSEEVGRKVNSLLWNFVELDLTSLGRHGCY